MKVKSQRRMHERQACQHHMTVDYTNWLGIGTMTEGNRRERYLWRKYNLCKALMAEKQATIRRLEAEIDALQDRKDRLGRTWAAEVKRLRNERV
jgi:hypothetical protein